MGPADARFVMALHCLSGLPVLDCRDALADAGGDPWAVLDALRHPSHCLPVTDAEAAAAFGSARPAVPECDVPRAGG